VIALEVGAVVFRRLKLLKYLHQINLSPEDTWALIRRLETESCRAEDYEVLIRTVRAHMELSADLLAASPVVEPSSPGNKAQRQRQGTKHARRRR
jgi:hypothetical protein